MSRNKIFATIAIVIGLILVVFIVVTDYPPEDASVAGTMADGEKKVAGAEPADRYRTEQITDADVELDDATIQVLLQDEDFIALVESGEMAAIAGTFDKVFARMNREDAAKVVAEKSVSRAIQKVMDASRGMEKSGDDLAKELARDLGKQFEKSNFERSELEAFAKEFLKAEMGALAKFEKVLDKLARMEATSELEALTLERAGDAQRFSLARILDRAAARAVERGQARVGERSGEE